MHKHKYEYEVVDLSVIKFHVNEGLLQRQMEKGNQDNLHFLKVMLL